jgi:hypothetical protein
MAVTVIPITSITSGSVTAFPSWTALTAGSDDGATIAAYGDTNDLLILASLTTTGSSASAMIFEAGDTNPPAFRAGLGDLKLATTGSGTDNRYAVVIESARHSSGSDGHIDVSFGSVVTSGSMCAFRLPTGW